MAMMALEELLKHLFSEAELRRFVRRDPDAKVLSKVIPDRASLSEIAEIVSGHYERRGQIGPDLLARLVKARRGSEDLIRETFAIVELRPAQTWLFIATDDAVSKIVQGHLDRLRRCPPVRILTRQAAVREVMIEVAREPIRIVHIVGAVRLEERSISLPESVQLLLLSGGHTSALAREVLEMFPLVISCGGGVSTIAEHRFVDAFYEALVEGKDVVRAFQDASKASGVLDYTFHRSGPADPTQIRF